MSHSQEMTPEQRTVQLEKRFELLEAEVGCLFRLMRVKLEADGLAVKCREIFEQWEQVMAKRHDLLHGESDTTEDTSPGRRSLAPVR